MKTLFILDHNTFQDDYIAVAQNANSHVSMIWYRIKGFPCAEIFCRAQRLREALPNSTLILSERADIAILAGFDGVHLNALSLPPAVVKEKFPQLIVGYSAHSAAECFPYADYVTLSPIFHTDKPYEVHPLGAIDAPADNVYALGGVTLDKMKMLEERGYIGVAGISFYKNIAFLSKDR